MNQKVLVFGGAGYCGSCLVPELLSKGFEVTVFDTFWYDPKFDSHPLLHCIKADIRNTDQVTQALKGIDLVIHLACISNDASFELDEALSTSINFDSFEPCVIAAKAAGVRRFVYASSSSVYGVSDQKNVTESHSLNPLTLYSKYKGMCEDVLLRHTTEDFIGVIFRPATVCGFAPRQRLDLSVNILTNHAINRGSMLVHGGNQLRPNLHILDYVDACILLLTAPDSAIKNEIFNIGMQNLSILEIAETVRSVIVDKLKLRSKVTIEFSDSNDLRSYHINSDKIASILGFHPGRKIEDAIGSLCEAFEKQLLPNSFDDNRYYNVRLMKELGVK